MSAQEIFYHRNVEIRLAKSGYGLWEAWSGGRKLTMVHQDKDLIYHAAINAVNFILDEVPDWQVASGVMQFPPPPIKYIE